MREIEALSSLNHPNIVKYYSCWFEEKIFFMDGLSESSFFSQDSFVTESENSDKKTISLFIQTEFCANSTLSNFFERRKKAVEPFIAFKIFDAILSGLRQIHKKGIIHRDLK